MRVKGGYYYINLFWLTALGKGSKKIREACKKKEKGGGGHLRIGLFEDVKVI